MRFAFTASTLPFKHNFSNELSFHANYELVVVDSQPRGLGAVQPLDSPSRRSPLFTALRVLVDVTLDLCKQGFLYSHGYCRSCCSSRYDQHAVIEVVVIWIEVESRISYDSAIGSFASIIHADIGKSPPLHPLYLRQPKGCSRPAQMPKL